MRFHCWWLGMNSCKQCMYIHLLVLSFVLFQYCLFHLTAKSSLKERLGEGLYFLPPAILYSSRWDCDCRRERSLRLRSAWLISAPVRSAKILWYLDKSRLVIAYLAHDYRLVVISCLLRFVISVQAFSAAQYSHKLRGVSSGRLIFISFWRILSLCKVEWFTPYHIFFVITAAVSIPFRVPAFR